MTLALFFFAALALSTFAGLLGSMLGLGGGIIVVPALTLLLGIDIRYAIGASIVSVIATSSGAAARYVRESVPNLRVAMFLELGTTVGALGGAFLAGLIAPQWLYVLFGLLLLFSAATMWRKSDANVVAPSDRLADALRLHGALPSGYGAPAMPYRVGRSRFGFVISIVAGVLSGLLGIGGGVLKVPAMNLAMGIPIKAATATSNLMIGVTAAASAGVYFSRGDIDPFIAAPVTLGALAGAALGAVLMRRVAAKHLKLAFTVVLWIVALEMMRKGISQ
ncbi:MAG: sulfite exporter TauE/SafE family protein [Phycisphaerae bacterium]|nr:sulfite exporter TauE/SafE family protein [Phycisphaerae bacterium]